MDKLINIALKKLEEASPGRTVDRNLTLKHFLNDFVGFDLQSSHLTGKDIIGDAYEFLITHFANDACKKANEFYTLLEISTLLAKLVDPYSGNRICDPNHGSGSLLIKVV